MTLYKATGLDFAHVFLPAWDSGVFSASYSEDPGEERRLAHVALTRGKDRVAITYCDHRHGGGGPDAFIADIPHANRRFGWLRQAKPQQPTRRIYP